MVGVGAGEPDADRVGGAGLGAETLSRRTDEQGAVRLARRSAGLALAGRTGSRRLAPVAARTILRRAGGAGAQAQGGDHQDAGGAEAGEGLHGLINAARMSCVWRSFCAAETN